MRELMATVVGAAITAAAGRGTGATGLLLMGITLGAPLTAGVLLTLLFTLTSRFLASLPLWSRDAWRELRANLGAMLLWFVVAFGGYVAIRTGFGLALGFSATAVPRLPPVTAVLAAVLATVAHLALAARARRNGIERTGWPESLAAGGNLHRRLLVQPVAVWRDGLSLHAGPDPSGAARDHVLPTPDIIVANYRMNVPFHDNYTAKGQGDVRRQAVLSRCGPA